MWSGQAKAEHAQNGALDELVRAGTLLSRELDIDSLITVLVDQSMDISASDLTCLFMHTDPGNTASPLRRVARRGHHEAPEQLDPGAEWLRFLYDCREAMVLLQRQPGPFTPMLLNDGMHSGIALPLFTASAQLGVLILNAAAENFYGRQRFQFLDSFSKLAGGLLHNARLFRELKEYLARIEALERYQQNIFSSMTNLLVTTDREGKVRYFNQAAGERLGLREADLGRQLSRIWSGRMDSNILRNITRARNQGDELLGVEGIFQAEGREIDFALNASPLHGEKGDGAAEEGVTLVLTDQSREKELQGQMETVVEERRAIRDMFARYLSNDIVQALMDSPDLVKPGGQARDATVLFADIRGYTSFSEGRDPGAIFRILNEYFNEAVQIIINSGGYIDKFIGDAIMAAWGVPLPRGDEQTIHAVGAALTIQQLIASHNRHFFRGEAEHLRVGIGMHTGPLVAGNLGSSQRMDYTVIGDTVNVAARLEGVAKAGEIIITQNTRDRLGDLFVLEPREAVKVKGKAEPIPIYAVLDKAV